MTVVATTLIAEEGLVYRPAGILPGGVDGVPSVWIPYGDPIEDQLRLIRRVWTYQDQLVVMLTIGVPPPAPYNPIQDSMSIYMLNDSFASYMGYYSVPMSTPTYNFDDPADWANVYWAVWATKGLRGLRLEGVLEALAV